MRASRRVIAHGERWSSTTCHNTMREETTVLTLDLRDSQRKWGGGGGSAPYTPGEWSSRTLWCVRGVHKHIESEDYLQRRAGAGGYSDTSSVQGAPGQERVRDPHVKETKKSSRAVIAARNGQRGVALTSRVARSRAALAWSVAPSSQTQGATTGILRSATRRPTQVPTPASEQDERGP